VWGITEALMPPRLKVHPMGERGIRLIWLSDLHCSRINSPKRIRKIVRIIQRASPDAVILGGDYVDRGLSYVEPCISILQALKPAAALLGNHDVQTKGGKNPRLLTVQTLESYGIRVLYNSACLLECGGYTLQLIGTGDCRRDIAYTAHIRREARADAALLLAHNPDALPAAAGNLDFDLALCGHTHGGQVSFFGKPLVTHTKHKQISRGFSFFRGKPVIVSHGTGTTILPLRFFSVPSVEVIDL